MMMFEKRLILQFKITFFGIFIKAMVNEKKVLDLSCAFG